jgi:hypothetical protein
MNFQKLRFFLISTLLQILGHIDTLFVMPSVQEFEPNVNKMLNGSIEKQTKYENGIQQGLFFFTLK